MNSEEKKCKNKYDEKRYYTPLKQWLMNLKNYIFSSEHKLSELLSRILKHIK